MIQITSGKGPEECERVVALVLSKLMDAAKGNALEAKVVDVVEGRLPSTYLSAMVLVKGNDLDSFCNSWTGTIQWIGQSPYRKFHKRKNWFVGVKAYDISKIAAWNEKDVVFQTMRASGPGGQNVNKVETAVRATHLPSGISVTASAERSQLQNKKEAIEKLKAKLMSWQIEQANKHIQEKWMEHNTLTRGDAIKVFEGRL